MTCGECGASFAKCGKSRFGCQGSAKKGEAYCANRLTIRQDELDRRVLGGLATELMHEDVLAAFVDEFAVETSRLRVQADDRRPEHEIELSDVTAQLANLKAAILKGVDPSLFVDEVNQLLMRQRHLEAQICAVDPSPSAPSILQQPDLGAVYREKVSRLTEAFSDEALRAEAFERIRALIESVVLMPEDGALAVHLRGELASILELCACGEYKKAPEAVASEALQIKLVAGTGPIRQDELQINICFI